MLMVNKDYH